MHIFRTIIGLSLIALLAASCAPSGYYDSNGIYHAYGRDDTYRHDKAITDTSDNRDYSDDTVVAPAGSTVIYTHPGYYDRNGYYIAKDSAPRLPDDSLPPRGMCRIWFADHRPLSDQPDVESCTGIRSRVPEGAYVIYGG